MSDGISDGHKYVDARSIYTQRFPRGEPAPAPEPFVDDCDIQPREQGDVIDRMVDAQIASCSSNPREAMIAAAKVLLDEALEPVTDKEWEEISKFNSWLESVNSMLASRRARLLPEAKDALTLKIAQIVSRFEGVTDSVEVAEEILAALRKADRP